MRLDFKNNLKLLGRAFINDNVLWLSYSGCGFEFVCDGSIKIGLVCDEMVRKNADESAEEDISIHFPRYAAYVDGVQLLDERLDEQERSVVIGPGEGIHTIRFIKLSESNDSSLGISFIETDGAMAEKTADKALRVEIIGDSITCGYGVDGGLDETYTTATENVSRAYSYLTVTDVDADYSFVSKSGAGIISGYTGDGIINTENLLPPYYGSVGCSLEGLNKDVHPKDIRYGFDFNPQLVVVNLGTNDISYCFPESLKDEEECVRRAEIFCGEYLRFLETVRACNKDAYIICMLGIMGTKLNAYVERAVTGYKKQTGDLRIEWLEFSEQLQEDGWGTDYHPTAATHRKAADRLAARIRELMTETGNGRL